MERIYYQKGGQKKIGSIKNRIFSKIVNEDRHLMRKLGNTPGIQSIIDPYLDLFDFIEIKTDKGKTFKVTKNVWLKNRFELSFGYGKQYFLSLKWWQIDYPEEKLAKEEIITQKKSLNC